MDSIEGSVSKIISHRFNQWSKAGIPTLIAALDTGVKVMGEMTKPERSSIQGEQYRFFGEWKDDKFQPGSQIFSFSSYTLTVESSPRGMVEYLSRHIEGIGVAKARALVERFGPQTIQTLREDARSCLEIPGFNEELCEAIEQHFSEESVDPEAYAKLFDLLDGYRKPKTLIKRLLKDWGSSAPVKIRENPYILLDYRGMGWGTVDELAMKRVGIEPNSPHRQGGAILEILKQRADQGHTVAPIYEVENLVHGLIGRKPDSEVWTELLDSGRASLPDRNELVTVVTVATVATVTVEDEPISNKSWVALSKYDYPEWSIAHRLQALMEAADPKGIDLDIRGLKGEQIEAGRMVCENPVVILAGPPGCGKSYFCGQMIVAYDRWMRGERKGNKENSLGDNPLHDSDRDSAHNPSHDSTWSCNSFSIRVMAPTGKAAKRCGEILTAATQGYPISIKPSTIHKALGFAGNADELEDTPEESARGNRGRASGGFAHNEDNPLSGSLFVIDELGMVPTRLLASLLKAIPLGARILLVGDPDQLPSIDAGSCLRDLIASKRIPTYILTEIRRSDGGGTIVKGCHAIRVGRTPQSVPKFNNMGGNWIHWELPDHLIGDGICALAKKEFDKGDDKGLQVISPQYKIAGFGINDLNERLSSILNPLPTTLVADSDELRFRVGDRVIRKKNKTVARLILPGEMEHDDDDYGEYLKISDSMVVNPDDFYADHREAEMFRWDGREYYVIKTDVVNGDTGIVEAVVNAKNGDYVLVRFQNPSRLCRLPLGECHLQRAFCLSVHSCQGSGYPHVIFPLSDQFHWDRRTGTGMYSRELVYTMFSRPETWLKTVGSLDSLTTAIGRKTIHQRQTRLREKIERVFLDSVRFDGGDESGETGEGVVGETGKGYPEGACVGSVVGRNGMNRVDTEEWQLI